MRQDLAEREGFEPSEHLVGIHAISSRAPSATRASLHDTASFSFGASPPLSSCR